MSRIRNTANRVGKDRKQQLVENNKKRGKNKHFIKGPGTPVKKVLENLDFLANKHSKSNHVFIPVKDKLDLYPGSVRYKKIVNQF